MFGLVWGHPFCLGGHSVPGLDVWTHTMAMGFGWGVSSSTDCNSCLRGFWYIFVYVAIALGARWHVNIDGYHPIWGGLKIEAQ